ncbi:peroxin 14/17 [Magnaporthiopsis poae ATCC 64411]|uniref:Peroxin 14/17 n=1 Tax=Magnaporthiopsis poae (strain ATCC 64411 / 73-15) TaxID=644358 RepID=A0A0C4EDX8_MAGP6|nr:peroxin 14/17 [Magnaporthiopsis poae ATCC 64411]
MGDSDKKESEPATAPEPGESSTQDDVQPESQSTLDVARRFLQTDEVRQASRGEKETFLAIKGLSETEIEALLDEDADAVASGSSETTDKSQEAAAEAAAVTTTENSEMPTSKHPAPVPKPVMPTRPLPVPVPEPQQPSTRPLLNPIPESTTYRAPIVTYPEFMTRRQRAPPLVTASGFMQTAAALAGFATVVYGASQYVLTPMVSSLTDARAEVYEQVSQRLDTLVSKLEETVSEAPPAPFTKNTATTTAATTGRQQDGDNDAASSCGDPTEVFHRDVGVQTDVVPPMMLGRRLAMRQKQEDARDPTGAQVRRLRHMTATLKEVKFDIATETDGQAEIKSSLETVITQLGGPSYRPPYRNLDGNPALAFGFSTWSPVTKYYADEAAKELTKNIRGVKGVLLTSRSFPAAGR